MLNFGEMVEWFKAAVLKTAAGSPRRGFESRSLRHFKLKNVLKVPFSTVWDFLIVKTHLYWLNPVLSNERTEHGHPKN